PSPTFLSEHLSLGNIFPVITSNRKDLKRFLQYLTARYKAFRSGSSIGKRTICHPFAILERRRGTIRIGKRCEIHRGVQFLAYGGSISIGDYCSINPGCILYGHGGLEIGSNVRIAAYTVIVPAN